MQTKSFPALNPKVVLGVAAHPDDIEFSAAGSVAKWAKDGADVYYLVLTDGSKGTADRSMTPEEVVATRRQEQRNACKILGVKDVFFLDYEDGTLANDMELKRDIARVIRQTKPDVVITMDPSVIYAVDLGFVNHPDHRAAGQATLDAVYPMARDHLSFPELLAEGLEPHIVATALLVNFDHHNFCVDISDTIETKLKAWAAHASQDSDVRRTQKMMRGIAEECGKSAGCKCAEAFMRIDFR